MLDSANVSCPYCGERIELLVDCSVPEQSYYEDCSVCCRPILVSASVAEDGEVTVVTRRDDE